MFRVNAKDLDVEKSNLINIAAWHLRRINLKSNLSELISRGDFLPSVGNEHQIPNAWRGRPIKNDDFSVICDVPETKIEFQGEISSSHVSSSIGRKRTMIIMIFINDG